MKRRGKITALSTGAVGVVLLGAAGLLAKDWIQEEYWLWRMQNGEPASQGVAAMHLGDLRSVRAVPVLVAGLMKVGASIHYIDQLPESIALIKIGKPATLELLKSWRRGRGNCDAACFYTLFNIHGQPEEAQVTQSRDVVNWNVDLFLLFLRNDCTQPPEVRQVAAEIFEKRQA